MALPVVAHVQAFLDQPFELGKAVDDAVRLVGVRCGAGKNFVDPGVVPADAIEKDRRDAGAFGRDDVGRAVAHVPAIEARPDAEVVEGLQYRVGVGFALRRIAAADGRLEQVDPCAVVDQGQLEFEKLAVAVATL